MKVKIKRFDKGLPLPEAEEFEHGASQDHDKGMVAAFDFYCRESVNIPPHEIRLVPVNNAIAVPRDHVLLLSARSSTSWKKGLMLANGMGIVDPFYSLAIRTKLGSSSLTSLTSLSKLRRAKR